MRHMVNGLQIGTGLIELIKLCQGMHTCSKNWMELNFRWLSMVSISRNISRACGKMSNEADVRHQAMDQCNQGVCEGSRCDTLGCKI
jgi:hypothetical protein